MTDTPTPEAIVKAALERSADTLRCNCEDEAKLKKAMEMALEGCPYRYGTDSYNEWWNNFRTILAAVSETHKLKGDSDD